MDIDKEVKEKIDKCPVCKVLVVFCEKSNDKECKDLAFKVIKGVENVEKWVDYIYEKFKEDATEMLIEAIKEVKKELKAEE
jgi:hypothetical protein